ncbi:MAG: F0F1 ATP synthase subunit A [Alphaproteobacteria bacterium]
METPLKQFVVKKLIPLEFFGIDLSFTNSALFMGIAVFLILILLFLGTLKNQTIPGRLQSFVELCYEFVANMLEENIGSRGKQFHPFVFSLFLFVLMGNFLGMIPYSFTFTSQIVLTFGLALIVFFTVILVGVLNHGVKFLTIFFPEGAPWVMAPLLVPIEIISFLSRPVSLAIRLFANMMAGHTMLKVFGLFTVSLGVFGFSTILANSMLMGFEFLVSFLQAYVFSVLTCLYLNDAIYLHS